MTVKDLLRPLPGVRRLSLMRQRLAFSGSASYWDRNYRRGGTSGGGSYGALGRGKAEFLNEFVLQHSIAAVVEFGCGDGHQVSLVDYPSYVGLDTSRSAIRLCQRRFRDDLAKSFFLYDGACFVNRAGVFEADMAISLDVIYHLVEDSVFEGYMAHLFAAARRYVVIYSTDTVMAHTGPHVRHRLISSWIAQNYPRWRLVQTARGPGSGTGRADFFVYQRPAL